MLEQKEKIYIAGHTGMVGSAMLKLLNKRGYTNLCFQSSKVLDLRDALSVRKFFEREKPEYVFLSAAKVGGIYANNTYRASFLYDNLMIASNIIHQSHVSKVKKLLFLGSSCIYPKNATQPIQEKSLLTGSLEPTNEPYAIAKIAGIKLCEAYRHQYGCNFISAMPTNLYGPNDSFDLLNAHVLPSLIHKIHLAKIQRKKNVIIWGTGAPLREFLHVDDLTNACFFLMNNYNEKEFVNIGFGEDISIKALAELICKIVKFNGKIVYDKTKPDGTKKKLIDSRKIHELGWEPTISLEKGIASTYQHFLTRFNKKDL